MQQVQSYYNENEKGWNSYDLSRLNKAQRNEVAATCTDTARFTYLETLAKGIGAVALAGGMVYVGFAASIIAAFFFETCLELFAGIISWGLYEFLSDVSILAAFYLVGKTLYPLMQKLFNTVYPSIQEGRNKADHYYDQAEKARLRVAEFA